jgi:hypothetical protein
MRKQWKEEGRIYLIAQFRPRQRPIEVEAAISNQSHCRIAPGVPAVDGTLAGGRKSVPLQKKEEATHRLRVLLGGTVTFARLVHSLEEVGHSVRVAGVIGSDGRSYERIVRVEEAND